MDQPFEAMGPVVDYEVPIRYSDMDLFGHVNNATYFSFWRGEDCVVRGVHPRKVGLREARCARGAQ